MISETAEMGMTLDKPGLYPFWAEVQTSSRSLSVGPWEAYIYNLFFNWSGNVFPEARFISERWWFHEQIGLLMVGEAPWIHNQRLGWVYIPSPRQIETIVDDPKTFQFYKPKEVGGMWQPFREDVYPYLYNHAIGEWVFLQKADGRSWEYRFDLQKWVPWD